MVRKVSIMLTCFALVIALGNRAQASEYSVYDGTMSSTYTEYFRGIISGIGFNEDYVAFRAGQYEYILFVGDLNYENGRFTGRGRTYHIQTGTGTYNGNITYTTQDEEAFGLEADTAIVYSSLGEYPELITRGEKYEILQTYTLCAIGLFVLFVRIFGKR